MLPGLEALVAQCAPQVAPQTMMAVVQTESRGEPWALNVNGGKRLARQPSSQAEAAAWAQWLVGHGYSVDIGLTQVNSQHLAHFGITPAQLLDPCINLAAGAVILTRYFSAASQHLNTNSALRAALSAYNTGNFRSGLANGYVDRVYLAALRPMTVKVNTPKPQRPPLQPASAQQKSQNGPQNRDSSQPEIIFGLPDGDESTAAIGSPLVQSVPR